MKRILVADDSVTIQKVIALTFAEEPFEVQSVGTGAEALELVKSWKPDIVLADVIMPQMNGYELCRAVKQQEETSSVPVLLLAGTFEAFDEEEAKSVGANDFITKPFESGELIEKVKTLIGGIPETFSAEAAPVVEDAGVAASPETPSVVLSQAEAPAPEPSPAEEASEPDIWDILSDSGDDAPEQVAVDVPTPGFGPIEGAGVVDVGSFDVGIGRPESPLPIPEPPAAAPPEAVQLPGAGEDVPVAPVADQIPDLPEKSRVENMEKDFFGFETGAVEEVPATDFLDDAIEEVTFEMEQPKAAPEVDAQEVSFVIPEPAGDQAVVTGETISPDFMAPEPPPVPEPEPEPVFAPAPVPEPMPVPPAPIPEPFQESPQEAPTEAPAEIAVQPTPEPPLELPVDLTPELPEGFSPEPIVEPVVEASVPLSPEPVMDVPVVPEQAVVASSQNSGDFPDDAAIRKLVEERVDKIAWEVVPEMAEVIIREVIQKIKDGS